MKRHHNNNGGAILIILVLIMIMPALFSVIGGILSAILPVLVIYGIYKLFKLITQDQASKKQIHVSGKNQFGSGSHSQAWSSQEPDWAVQMRKQAHEMAGTVKDNVKEQVRQSLRSIKENQTAGSQTPPKPPKSYAGSYSRPSMHPYYKRNLEQLERDTKVIPRREKAVNGFLEDLFGGSSLTKNRYKQVIDHAQDILEDNYAKAKKAIELFDNQSEPAPERREIIDRYVQDSDDIISSFEKVVNELIRIQQNETLEKGDVLDENLKNLAETTHYYQQH